MELRAHELRYPLEYTCSDLKFDIDTACADESKLWYALVEGEEKNPLLNLWSSSVCFNMSVPFAVFFLFSFWGSLLLQASSVQSSQDRHKTTFIYSPQLQL